MPAGITRQTHIAAWLTLIVQIGIVLTGGLVRLTGSGLGCPTWPLCTDASLVPTAELSYHSLIEFGNRTLTGVLVLVGLFTLATVWNTRGRGAGVFGPAVTVLALTALQALVGGVSVLRELDPRIVGVHFLISAGLVSVSAVLLQRVRLAGRASRAVRPRALRIAIDAVIALTWITLVLGVLTTGAGPHAGDTAASRNGLDPAVMQHVHAWPAYVLAIATAALVVIAMRRGDARRILPYALSLAAILAVQIAIGLAQSRLGLPIGLVAAHMVVSVIALATATAASVAARRPPAG